MNDTIKQLILLGTSLDKLEVKVKSHSDLYSTKLLLSLIDSLEL